MSERQSVSPDTSAISSGLSFEQHKELLLLQIEHDKVKLEKEVVVEKLKQEEHARIEIEITRLQLIKEGKLSAVVVYSKVTEVDLDPALSFVVLVNLKLLPKFSERDPEMFFLLFERVAAARQSPRTL